MNGKITRTIAGFLSVVLFATNGLFAYAPESNFWTERRRESNRRQAPMTLASLPSGAATDTFNLLQKIPEAASRLSQLPNQVTRQLPAGFLASHQKLFAALDQRYGTVRKISLPSQASSPQSPVPVVIHIQDVHMNSEAQENIGKTIQAFIENHAADMVALEGAFTPLDLSKYRAFPDQDTIQEVADVLRRDNKISGAVHAALVSSQEPPSLVGVDDARHYWANVTAYQKSAPRMAGEKHELALRADLCRRRKAKELNTALRDFDARVEAYGAGSTSLGDYLRALENAAGNAPESIRTFLQALDTEKALDFKQVESERVRLVRELTERLGRGEISELMARSAAYRSGQMGYAGFYEYLQNICRTHNVNLGQFPAMDAYIRYVLLADKIQAEPLFQDSRRLEEKAYARLVRTENEKLLIQESRRLYLRGKLLDFSLTPEEWKEHKAFNSVRPELVQGRSIDLAAFEAFYQEAQIRDEAMAGNLIKAMGKSPLAPLFQRGRQGRFEKARIERPSVAVLVTGGFHSEGIREKLNRAGVAVISFTPKIEKIDSAQGSAYLSVFSQEKTPLEKLFQGRKLFLTPDPFSRATKDGTGPALAVALKYHREIADSLRNKTEGTPLEIFQALSSDPNAEKSDVTAFRLPDNQVGIQVTKNRERATMLVSFEGEAKTAKITYILRKQF